MQITSTWREYNLISQELSLIFGRTNNFTAEYAELLAVQYLDGTILPPSNKSADIQKDGKTYQVKARRIEQGTTTQLGIIRSWDFDYLITIIFDTNGDVVKACQLPVGAARKLAVKNNYQNGYVITTNRNFFNHPLAKDITSQIKKYNGETVITPCEIIHVQTRTFTKLGRIQAWANSPEQNNHKIIKAYLHLSRKNPYVKKTTLEMICSDKTRPQFFVEKFRVNFNSMKTDAGHAHGKVFFEDDGYVYIYPQAQAEINKYFLAH